MASETKIENSTKFDNKEIESINNIADEFENLTIFEGYEEKATLEDSGLTDDLHKNCKICKRPFENPRILTCLHVFCEKCLVKILMDETGDFKTNGIIICPVCKQSTKVGKKGIDSLMCDYIYTNILDLSTIEPGMLACTSCKSKENALSRCNDCANFLCAGCDNAHKYMRCFENHQVVKLDELRKSTDTVSIHKPLFCVLHAGENLKYYCYNCQVPLCNECLIAEHKGSEHHYDILTNAEKIVRVDVENLVQEAKAKIKYCDDAALNLGSSLTELQTQHDSAKNAIQKAYELFKNAIEKCQNHTLQELEKLHSDRELKIMDMLQNVEKTVERIDGVCKFTSRVLDQANAAEFLSLKKLIYNQFMHLINNIPKADINFSLEFETNFEKFEQIVQESFGKLRTESTAPSPKESTPPPTLPGLPPVLRNMSTNSSQGAPTGSVTASSPISLPASMQSSFEGDISALGNSFIIPSVLAIDPPQQATNTLTSSVVAAVGPSIQGFSSIAEYNLQRLANLAEATPDITETIVTTNNPPTNPNFTLADILSGDQRALNNLQALAKLGLNNPEYTEYPNNHMMSGGSGPGMIDSLLPDFVNLSRNNSPLNPMPSLNEEITLSTYLGMGGMNPRGKATSMQTRWKFGSLGTSKGQFNSPHGFCLGVDEEIIVADTNNHRIQVFEKDGSFKFQFGVPGKEEGQLWYPRKVAVMPTNNKFVICDRGNERSRMQIFSKNGHFMKKVAIRYIDIVAGLAVTAKGQIVAVDSVTPTVFIISEEGDLIHWFDCSDFMREPSDIAIRDNDFYICDFKGHCVAVFKDDGTFQYRIGNEKITCFPNGIDISNARDILIGDSHGNRFHVACFSREGVLQSEFECPNVKVSRCCGLKITSEGYVVTLAKNNHHVLVLNTLYLH